MPITRCFINDADTVRYGESFLKIICLACPSTAVNFMAITIFQATGRKAQPLPLSLLHKGSLDVAFMIALNRVIGINGIAWATPFADWLALLISIALIVPCLKQLNADSCAPIPPAWTDKSGHRIVWACAINTIFRENRLREILLFSEGAAGAAEH